MVPILLISRVDLADFDEWASPLPPSLSHVKLSVSSVLVAGGVCPPCPCHHSILPLPVPVSPGSFCITTTDLSLELHSQVLEGTSPTWTGEGNGSPLQCSCLENPMDGGAWWAAVHGVPESRMRLSDFTFILMHWRRKWQATPVFLPGESHGRRSLVGCSPRGPKESDMPERLRLRLRQFHQKSLKLS